MIDLSALRRNAEGALAVSENIGEDRWYTAKGIVAAATQRDIECIHALDAAHIADNSPEVTLALVEVVEAAHRLMNAKDATSQVIHFGRLRAAAAKFTSEDKNV